MFVIEVSLCNWVIARREKEHQKCMEVMNSTGRMMGGGGGRSNFNILLTPVLERKPEFSSLRCNRNNQNSRENVSDL